MLYCTVAEVRAAGVQIQTNNELTPASDSLLTAIITRASRMFDRACGVVDGYFAVAGTAAARTFYGSGTGFLRLDPYTELTSISLPEGYSTPEYVARNGYLIRSASGIAPSSEVWPVNVPVTVTAKWGFSEIPADVNHAVLELTINLLKETDPASIKLMSLENQPLREELPPRVKMIARNRRPVGVFL